MHSPTRRDFLRLGSLLSGTLAASGLARQPLVSQAATDASLPNILIFVFDAMSAKNLSLYGYPRHTTPNLERFAARATVYNQHYSPASFTTPGTASLLTGLYPWTHRAINYSGLIAPPFVDHNIFRALGPQHFRVAYSQNVWVDYFFGQFKGNIEQVLSPGAFSLLDQVVGARFGADLVHSHRAFDDLLFQDKHAPASLVFGLAQDMALYEAVVRAEKNGNPDDIARTENYAVFFRLRDVFEGMLKTIAGLPSPSLAYFHTWSPHSPYCPSHDFASLFADNWHPPNKPMHTLGYGTRRQQIALERRSYDNYIANVDFEFGRLLDGLEARGILDRSYVIVTSDHGEMFERGTTGHTRPLLYEPVVRVPLIISSPGQTSRRDVNVPTSNVDLLPTLAHLTGGEAPAGCEGQVLPGFGVPIESAKSIYMMDAKYNRPYLPLTNGTFGLRKGPHKLIYYRGYEQYGKQDKFELYDVEKDPEELQDLYLEGSRAAQDLKAELLARIDAENVKLSGAG